MIATVGEEPSLRRRVMIGQEAEMDRRLFGARALGVLCLSVAAASSAGAAMRHAPDARLAAKIDAYIRPFVEGENFPGAILVSRGDDILFSKAYGMANYELKVPNTPRHRFHLAS